LASRAEEEENYWPGYVDALTTMTMVLTFIMMVLAFAVFIMSQNVSKVKVDIPPMETKSDNVPTAPKTPDPVVEIDVPKASPGAGGIQDASEKVAGSSPYENKVEAPESVISAPVENTDIKQSVIEDDTKKEGQALAISNSVITLTYAGVETRLDEETLATIEKVANERAVVASDQIITIKAYANAVDAPISQMRRVAYYRAMLLRSALIDAGVEKERIDVKVVETDAAAIGQTVRVFLDPKALN
jgi:Na+-transporting methylmalonyl-CoA/oxaloacetate decarboxylase gamma subunit